MVNARRDSVVPEKAVEALFDAAGEPKQLRWFDTDHDTLPGSALKAMLEFLSGPLGPLFHDSLEPFAVGESVSVAGLTATILTQLPDGRPATVRFRFDEPVDSPTRRWVQFRDGRFVPFEPPAVGDSAELPPALGPLDLLNAG